MYHSAPRVLRDAQDDNSYKNSQTGPIDNKSELKFQTGEASEQRLSSEDVFETAAGNQARESSAHYDVLAERWAILNACTKICPDGMMNRALKEHDLDRLGAIKAQVISIQKRLQLWGEIEVGTQVPEPETGIYEIRLPFFFA